MKDNLPTPAVQPKQKGLRSRINAKVSTGFFILTLFCACAKDDLPDLTPPNPPSAACVEAITGGADSFKRFYGNDTRNGAEKGELVGGVELCNDVTSLDVHFGSESSNAGCNENNLVCIDLRDGVGNTLFRIHSAMSPQGSYTFDISNTAVSPEHVKQIATVFHAGTLDNGTFNPSDIARLIVEAKKTDGTSDEIKIEAVVGN